MAMTVEKQQARQTRNYEFYSAQYSRFSSILASDIEREAYGEDLGQQLANAWRTTGNHQARQRAAASPIA